MLSMGISALNNFCTVDCKYMAFVILCMRGSLVTLSNTARIAMTIQHHCLNWLTIASIMFELVVHVNTLPKKVLFAIV